MSTVRRVGLYAALTLAALTFIYPFLWMISSTLKPPFDVGTLELIPDRITLDNYRTMWARAPFGTTSTGGCPGRRENDEQDGGENPDMSVHGRGSFLIPAALRKP